jgi:predicted GNAT family acetyltransferase
VDAGGRSAPAGLGRAELRGQGYGKRGLADLCRLLLETTPNVCLFVRPENAPAIGLYEGIGMRRTITYRSLIFA